MALALHHTSQHDHYAGGKTELLGSEQRTEDHVASRFELSVYLQGNKTAQVVEYKRLLYLGKPQFGWHPRHGESNWPDWRPYRLRYR